MADEQKQPVMSMIPFEKLMDEVVKLQGDRPALIVLYTGQDDLTILKHNLGPNDPIMDMFMKHLVWDVLRSKGVQVTIVKTPDQGSNLSDNEDKTHAINKKRIKGTGKASSKGSS